CFRNLERFISGLDIFRFRLEHVLGLFEIEKGAANFRGNRATRRFERSLGRFATRVSCLHPAFGREAVEQMPRPADADEITMIEFRTGRGVAFVVNFIARKSLEMRTQLAAIDLILSIFDLDVDLAGPYFGAFRVGTSETFV